MLIVKANYYLWVIKIFVRAAARFILTNNAYIVSENYTGKVTIPFSILIAQEKYIGLNMLNNYQANSYRIDKNVSYMEQFAELQSQYSRNYINVLKV